MRASIERQRAQARQAATKLRTRAGVLLVVVLVVGIAAIAFPTLLSLQEIGRDRDYAAGECTEVGRTSGPYGEQVTYDCSASVPWAAWGIGFLSLLLAVLPADIARKQARRDADELEAFESALGRSYADPPERLACAACRQQTLWGGARCVRCRAKLALDAPAKVWRAADAGSKRAIELVLRETGASACRVCGGPHHAAEWCPHCGEPTGVLLVRRPPLEAICTGCGTLTSDTGRCGSCGGPALAMAFVGCGACGGWVAEPRLGAHYASAHAGSWAQVALRDDGSGAGADAAREAAVGVAR